MVQLVTVEGNYLLPSLVHTERLKRFVPEKKLIHMQLKQERACDGRLIRDAQRFQVIPVTEYGMSISELPPEDPPSNQNITDISTETEKEIELEKVDTTVKHQIKSSLQIQQTGKPTRFDTTT